MRPGRTWAANSSVRAGRMRLEAETIVTSKMASLPARSLFLRAFIYSQKMKVCID